MHCGVAVIDSRNYNRRLPPRVYSSAGRPAATSSHSLYPLSLSSLYVHIVAAAARDYDCREAADQRAPRKYGAPKCVRYAGEPTSSHVSRIYSVLCLSVSVIYMMRVVYCVRVCGLAPAVGGHALVFYFCLLALALLFFSAAAALFCSDLELVELIWSQL